MDFYLDVKKKIIIMTVIILMAASLAGYNFIYKANLEKASRINRKIQEAKKINSILSGIKTLQDAMGKYSGMQAESSDPGWFLSYIAAIANSCGVNINSIAPNKSSAYGKGIVLSAKMSFDIPYHRLGKFISKMESDSKFIKIELLSITPIKQEADILKKSQGEGVWVKVDLDISGFYHD